MGAQPRASLSEDIFIEELERKGMAMEDSVAANREQEEVRSSEDPATVRISARGMHDSTCCGTQTFCQL